MYTRNYQMKKEPPKPCAEDSAIPPIEEETACESVEMSEMNAPVTEENAEIRPKRRFRAVRIPVLKERCEEQVYRCPSEAVSEPACCEQDREDVKRGKNKDRGGFLRSFSNDELFVIALIVLLMCEGGDDILILALCFILA